MSLTLGCLVTLNLTAMDIISLNNVPVCQPAVNMISVKAGEYGCRHGGGVVWLCSATSH